MPVSRTDDTKKRPLSFVDNGRSKRGRRDLNPQPPDRQSVDGESYLASGKQVTSEGLAACTNACTADEEINREVTLQELMKVIRSLSPGNRNRLLQMLQVETPRPDQQE